MVALHGKGQDGKRGSTQVRSSVTLFKGGGVKPFNFENTIPTYGLGVIAWTCTSNFRVVLGLCAQYCPSL